jgi:hypothetical protein
MSIPVLQQVYDETRRLSIAGSGLAAGDFRLKKLVEPLQASAAKAPVFGKVADAIKKVVEAQQDQSANALLELGTLTTAILYTQGDTAATGTITPIQTVNLGLPTANTSARVLKPLIEALTTTGAGRMELIKDAHERGAFKDLRLMRYAVAAIDDKYGEIGDFVAKQILPIYGRAIYPEVQAGYDPKGKGDDGRRLRLMHQLDPEATRPLVDAALEEGSKDVKLAAIACLEGRADAVEFLLEQVKAKAQDVRAAALQAISSIDTPEVIEVLKKALASGDVGRVAAFVPKNPSSELQKFVVEEARSQLQGLFADDTKPAKGKAAAKAAPSKTTAGKDPLRSFFDLLQAFRGRTDQAAEEFLLDCFARQNEFLKLKAGYLEGCDLNRRVAEMMLLSGSKRTLEKLVAAGPNVTLALIEYTFLAAGCTRTPAQVFDQFAAAFANRPTGKTKAAEEAQVLSIAIGEVLSNVVGWHRHPPYTPESLEDDDDDVDGNATYLWEIGRKVELDPRWLDEAVKVDDLTLMIELARPGHAALNQALKAHVDAELAKKKWNPHHTLDDVLEAMIDIQHPDLLPKFLAVMERVTKATKDWWGVYFMTSLIPKMPPEAIEPLEAMIPQIDAKLIDSFVGPLEVLKRKHEPALA